ncbi:MAG TPA: hypothetical protein VLT86_01465 [Vicinamibacterales bacterium]|nr:hypothetical protein [Vicinamibacterales bacterium]
MSRRLSGVMSVMAVALVWAAGSGLAARQDPAKSAAPSVAGKWSMSVQGDQGAMSASLVFNVDGKKVTGTLTSDHTGEAPLEGTFQDGALAFSVSVRHDGADAMELSFTGKLKDDGTLAGTLSGPMGEIAWTATRVK